MSYSDIRSPIVRLEVHRGEGKGYYFASLEIKGASGLQSDWIQCDTATSITGAITNAVHVLAPMESEARKQDILGALL